MQSDTHWDTHWRIVFLENTPGGLVVDALSSDGRVLSMDAAVPVSMWGFAAALTLGRWAELGSQVEVALYDKRGMHRVRLRDEEHLIVLDLQCPAKLSSHIGSSHIGSSHIGSSHIGSSHPASSHPGERLEKEGAIVE